MQTEADVTKNTRVLLVDGGDEFGGQQVHVLQLVEGFRELDLHIGLVCRDRTLAGRASAEGVPTFVEKFSSPADLATSRRIACAIRKEGFSLLHTHGTRAGVIGRIAAKLAGVPCVHTAHIMVTDIVPGDGFRAALKRRFYRTIETWLARMSNMTICVSHGLEEKHRALGIPKDKLVVIHNSASLPEAPTEEMAARARTELGVDQDRAVVGIVARLCPGKGIEVLMRAAVEILRKRRALFLVAGDGPLRARLESEASSLGLGEDFRFLGFREDINNVYLALNVCTLPSVGEGHPLTVLEAMAFARPVVATAVSGNVEAVVDEVTGILVAPDDPDALAAALLRLLDSPAEAAQMGQKGREVVRTTFNHQRMCELTRSVYQRVLAGDPNSPKIGG